MAVYTEIEDADLIGFVATYDIGEVLSFKGIAEGVENTNYLVHTDRASYILTLYEKRVAEADLPFFLGLMEHLADRGVHCATPVHDREGRTLRRLAGRPAALVTFLEGMWPKRPQPHHCRAVGVALARLHEAARDYGGRRANALDVAGWRPLLATVGDEIDRRWPGLGAEIDQELGALERDWPVDLPIGTIHADLFPDNVFFLGETLSGLIDFYFACQDVLAYDVAICLNAWCFEPDLSFNVTKARALLSGYETVRPFTAEEYAALPILARGAAMRFFATRVVDWITHQPGTLVKPHDPIAYLKRLRFHRTVDGAGAYGIEPHADGDMSAHKSRTAV